MWNESNLCSPLPATVLICKAFEIRRRHMADILPMRRKTLSNKSINSENSICSTAFYLIHFFQLKWFFFPEIRSINLTIDNTVKTVHGSMNSINLKLSKVQEFTIVTNRSLYDVRATMKKWFKEFKKNLTDYVVNTSYSGIISGLLFTLKMEVVLCPSFSLTFTSSYYSYKVE